MNAISYTYDTQAVVKRVYYEGTSTIYEGMPVCYNFDSTTNMVGYGAATLGATKTYQSTTAEGEMNEGKFIRVENPAADNLLWFAGVVVGNQQPGRVGPAELDIYIPNGAVVPVRAGVECTKGKTVLSIISATQYLGQPLSATQARPVAIAEETNATLDTTNGLILARLCPQEFIYQELTGDALSIAVAGTSNIVVNRINVTSAQTAGTFCAFEVQGTSTAGATSSGYGLAFYAQANVTGTVTGHIAGSGIWLNVTGGTPTEYITALEVGLYEDGATMTSAGRTSVLTLSAQVDDDVTANNYGWVYLAQNGTQVPDDLILGSTLASLPAVVFTGTVALGVTTAYGIKVYLANQPGTQQWYIPLVNTLG